MSEGFIHVADYACWPSIRHALEDIFEHVYDEGNKGHLVIPHDPTFTTVAESDYERFIISTVFETGYIAPQYRTNVAQGLLRYCKEQKIGPLLYNTDELIQYGSGYSPVELDNIEHFAVDVVAPWLSLPMATSISHNTNVLTYGPELLKLKQTLRDEVLHSANGTLASIQIGDKLRIIEASLLGKLLS